MIGAAFPRHDAELFTRLPEALHWTGEPTDWVRATRPGQRLHSFLEGPCFDAEGHLWLADVPYGRLFRIAPDGGWQLAFQYDGEPHALRPRGDGTWLIVDYRRGLLAFDPVTKTVTTLCARVNTEPFRGLSDLTVAPDGDVWFTDSGRTSLSDPTGRVYRLRQGATVPELILANVPYPNGIALSPDGTLVYLAATRANAVWRFMAEAPDPAWPMVGTFLQLSGGLGPDGLAVDAAGRLAIAQAQAGRLYLVDALGDALAVVHTPGGLWTTACAFSPDQSSLFIVEAQTGSVFRIPMATLLAAAPSGRSS
ncbi:SMP-30/gluconolactonase/LRE family protein [Bosea sp. LjRoot90]|uniref:SMP-30/gluconolactonase/LRE family protein n=1 Tax=Bosea sp. LjRoot90 TaxID=3342342 RepID=UPI003ED15B6A